jgi:hypothetical protein
MKRFLKISIIQKGGRILMIVLSVCFVCICIFAGMLLICSPGKAIPFMDEGGNRLEGSISEKAFVTIGGVSQGMFIKSLVPYRFNTLPRAKVL